MSPKNYLFHCDVHFQDNDTARPLLVLLTKFSQQEVLVRHLLMMHLFWLTHPNFFFGRHCTKNLRFSGEMREKLMISMRTFTFFAESAPWKAEVEKTTEISLMGAVVVNKTNKRIETPRTKPNLGLEWRRDCSKIYPETCNRTVQTGLAAVVPGLPPINRSKIMPTTWMEISHSAMVPLEVTVSVNEDELEPRENCSGPENHFASTPYCVG